MVDKNFRRKKINLFQRSLLKKEYRFFRNRKNKIGKLTEEYINEKIKDSQNKDFPLDGIIEFYKFTFVNNPEDNLKNNNNVFKKFEIKKIDDINEFINFIKNQDFSKDYYFFINIDIPVSFLPLDFYNFFGIDSLTVEDILSEDHYVKIDIFPNYTYFSIIIPTTSALNITSNFASNDNLKIMDNTSFENINIILKDNVLIIIQEGIKGDIFDIIRKRIDKNDKNLVKSMDYLLYYIFDVIVDKYMVILENIEDQGYKIEQDIFGNDIFNTNINSFINNLYNLKKNTILIKNFILKFLEIIKVFKNNYSEQEKIINYYKDLLDHIYRVLDVIENLEHIFNNILNLYISKLNYKQNDIMRILTVVNTIFVPIIFIASIYGMNFEYIPELKWKYGYFFTLFIMLVIAFITIIYFKRKNIL